MISEIILSSPTSFVCFYHAANSLCWVVSNYLRQGSRENAFKWGEDVQKMKSRKKQERWKTKYIFNHLKSVCVFKRLTPSLKWILHINIARVRNCPDITIMVSHGVGHGIGHEEGQSYVGKRSTIGSSQLSNGTFLIQILKRHHHHSLYHHHKGKGIEQPSGQLKMWDSKFPVGTVPPETGKVSESIAFFQDQVRKWFEAHYISKVKLKILFSFAFAFVLSRSDTLVLSKIAKNISPLCSIIFENLKHCLLNLPRLNW